MINNPESGNLNFENMSNFPVEGENSSKVAQKDFLLNVKSSLKYCFNFVF